MHAIQGAMAIRRERQKREVKRQSQIRRSSSKRSPRSSDASGNLDNLPAPTPAAGAAPPEPEAAMENNPKPPSQKSSSLTAFHLGVVFILMGFLMVFSAMITNSVVEGDWSRLLGVGVTFIIVGLIMVMVNRIITAREEEELARYVSGRLARTRSGHAVCRDLEAGEDIIITPIRTIPRRTHSTKVPRSPSVLHRTASTRSNTGRSIRGHPPTAASATAHVPRSSSIHSHLSVKNGNLPSSSPTDVEAVGLGGCSTSEVVVTETETLLPKGDNNVPALIVTKQTRKPSKRLRKPSVEKS
jgi:hypothetical protein